MNRRWSRLITGIGLAVILLVVGIVYILNGYAG